MISKILVFKVLCLYCMVKSDFLQENRFLRVPNPDKTWNTVLNRLERGRLDRGLPMDTDAECSNTKQPLPEYTESLENANIRSLRQLISQVPFQKLYPICHLERKIIRLNTNEYEYRPAYYEEVECIPKMGEGMGPNSEICTSLGFSCIQLNKTIHLTRRRYDGDCWETRTMVINAGCECMWPAHKLGDIGYHQ